MVTSIIDYIDVHCKQFPNDVAIRYLRDGENDVAEFTYFELVNKAKSLAAIIRSEAKPKSNVLLLYAPGTDFIVAFLACLYAGVTAIPTYPPIPRRLNIDTLRLERICQNAHPDLILADTFSSNLLNVAMLKENAKGLFTQLMSFGKNKGKDFVLAHTPIKVTSGLNLPPVENFELPNIEPDDLAMLQYSSGSTGDPKGVMVTHNNLLVNIQSIEDKIFRGAVKEQLKDSSTMSWVTWLPHYHDMGLIGTLLLPLVKHHTVTCISPFAFLEKPMRWFKAITKYRPTCAVAPNFGYELCLKHYRKNPDPSLDLSSIVMFASGAEPIDPELPGKLAEAFKEIGYRYETFCPVYGLAEHTVMVSGEVDVPPLVNTFDFNRLHEDGIAEIKNKSTAENTIDIIACGTKIDKDHEIRIVDPETLRFLSEGSLGEIWLRGPSVAKGYWAKPEVTDEIFNAYTEDGKGPFLRSGDMGFMIDGKLYIFGRIKDILIIRGKKYAPQDLEFSVQNSHEGIRKGNVAVFGVTVDQEERVVVVAEKSDSGDYSNEEIFNAIIKAIAGENGISTYEIVLIKPRSIQKTTSGKIQRRANKELYLNNELPVVGNWKSPLAALKSLEDVRA